MEKVTAIRKIAIEKAYNYLVELHLTLMVTDKINLQDLATRHKVSRGYSTLLRRKGILLTVNGKSSWVGGKPTKELANDLLEISREYHNPNKKNKVKVTVKAKKEPLVAAEKEPVLNKKEAVKKVTKKQQRKKKPVPKQREFNLLWGALKFNY
jgi:hypothetical protein